MNRLLFRAAFAASILIYCGLAAVLSGSGGLQGNNLEMASQLNRIFAVTYAVLVLLVAPRVSPEGRGFLVRLACYEAGAVFGLVLFFLSGQMVMLAPYAAIALVLVLLR